MGSSDLGTTGVVGKEAEVLIQAAVSLVVVSTAAVRSVPGTRHKFYLEKDIHILIGIGMGRHVSP